MITQGQVYAVDAEHRRLVVLLNSGQLIPVKMAHDGYADAMRIRQTPLPSRGTRGVIALIQGDIRSGVWLGSVYMSYEDAIGDPNDPTLDYHAHWSGAWSYLNASGTTAFQWPDGSYAVFGSGATLPTVYRHTVGQDQKPQLTAYQFSDRVPNPPNPFVGSFVQAGSGLTATLEASGVLAISGGSSGAAGSLTLKFGGSTVTVDASGNITLNVAAAKNLLISDGGSASDGVPLWSLLEQWLNTHVHTNGNNGANTGTAVTPATNSIMSQIIKLQQ